MKLDEKKRVITDFLTQCNRYAEGRLAEYRAELVSASGRRALELQDKIGHWTAYHTFNEHTLMELESTTLDEWFAESGPGAG
jgi:hypothetical protein